MSEGEQIDRITNLFLTEYVPGQPELAPVAVEIAAFLVSHGVMLPETPPLCPDCRAGKCGGCGGAALLDEVVDCRCRHPGWKP